MKQTKLDNRNEMFLLPPSPEKCQECAVKHEKGAPHDQTSLYYHFHFHRLHGRYPTWADAVRHCSKPIRDDWEEELRKRGLWK